MFTTLLAIFKPEKIIARIVPPSVLLPMTVFIVILGTVIELQMKINAL